MVFVSPAQEIISLSYKLEFEATNNVAEYEALILGLRAAREMGIQEVAMFGDAELVTMFRPSILDSGITEMRYGI